MYPRPPSPGQSSYLDLGSAGPFALAELGPGVRNVLDYAGLRAGERLLILAEHGVDPLIVGAIGAIGGARDADVHVLSIPPVSPGGSDRTGPAPLVVSAYAEADVVVSLVWWAEVHSQALFFTEIPKHRARLVTLQMTATASMLATGARFPLELFYVIKRRILERSAGCHEIRVTTDRGTDVTFTEPRIDTDAGPLEPGMWRPFPLGGLNFYPDSTSGVLVIEESTATGVPEEPLRIELRDNLVSAIDGGVAAFETRAFSPAGYYLRHAFIGLNPKVRCAGAPQFEREKHAGAFYLGLDALPGGRIDRSGPGFAHNDCQFDRPWVSVDGVPLVEHGHLLVLDDDEVRAAAAAYADPDGLLNDNPRLTLRPAQWQPRAGA